MIQCFEGSAAKLFQHFKGRPVAFLEIGVFEGQAACFMLDNYLTDPRSYYDGIEIDESRRLLAADNIRRGEHSPWKWTLAGGKSDELLTRRFSLRVYLAEYDGIYIDGDHREEAVYRDAILSWPFLAKGGIVLFDDYTLEQSSIDSTVKFGVKKAVHRFLSTLDQAHYEILLDDYQFAIKRLT